MIYDIPQIREQLTLDDVEYFLNQFGAEPRRDGDAIISRTICHNPLGEGSHKLYYYDNTHLFHCYSGCDEPSFDIFELTTKIKSRQYEGWVLYNSVEYVANFFGIAPNYEESFTERKELQDWEYFNSQSNQINLQKDKEALPEYENVIRNYPLPHIIPWEQEGIEYSVMQHRGIKYDPVNCGILISHYDINNRLVGIRTRTLVREEEQYGKYRPSYISGKLYNHPLSFNLYNLNYSAPNIKQFGKAIVFESEKSCLKYASYFGESNDISVAVCGSNVIEYQIGLLMAAGAQEIVIALDKQFQSIGDDEWKKLTKNLTNIHTKYGNRIQISYMFDSKDLTGYKDAPIDCGKDVFLRLFKERVVL